MKKVLAGALVICTVSPPFAGLAAVDNTRRFNWGRRTKFLLITGQKNFPKSAESFLTALREIDWLFVFPPKGKIFENYFVRLIGTPNQNLKNDSDLVSESCK